MILNALYDLYQRLVNDPSVEVAAPYHSMGKVSAAIEISPSGEILKALPLGTQKGKRRIPLEMQVPERVKRASGNASNFLCDKSDYILGIEGEGVTKRALQRFEVAKELHEEILSGVEDEGAEAVLAFFRSWKPETYQASDVLQNISEVLADGGNIVFRLQNDSCYVHERDAVRRAWENYKSAADPDAVMNQCLITGEVAPVARLHQNIMGIAGAKTTGASLVSFNFDATESYGKKQGANSPVSESAAFAYGTALNWLTSNDRHRLLMGDTTVVFWAEKAGPEEDLMLELFADAVAAYSQKEEKDTSHEEESAVQVKGVLKRIMRGQHVETQMAHFDEGVKFYILGLAPNSARVAIRFWHVDTFGKMLERVRQHFDDMSIVCRPDERPVSVGRLLFETTPAVSRKRENIPPILSGSLMRAILDGSMYPQSLYTTIIGRIRSDANDPDKPNYEQKITYPRAAYIKAHLIRKARLLGNKKMEEALKPVLNPENKNKGYLLGRLFALLEKVQQDANPGIKATIKDRYYASASATPRAVFPVLLRLAQHHITKAEFGGYIDRLIGEVLADLDSFPTYLNLDEQGLFALGYYQQKNALYNRAGETSA
ncbi:MAG: type I-C CRISPR-associated protein Cas8c/Csd1 [Firmicutes bacterium]|nr:type I-C CRISPR-associated protein Cas8c/Csd1 [Bacillota bacterium]HQD40083.1 type I-C CRISPR-associated protein Cas8c/Csd1 [Bacillota bacterium]